MERVDPAMVFYRTGERRLDADEVEAILAYAPSTEDWYAVAYPFPARRPTWERWRRPVRPVEDAPAREGRSPGFDADQEIHPWPRLVYTDCGRRVPPHLGADAQAEVAYRSRKRLG
jgi:hypothetical protein